MNITAFARKKAEPMVRGLLPQIEQENVLALLERSLVFLSPATIGPSADENAVAKYGVKSS